MSGRLDELQLRALEEALTRRVDQLVDARMKLIEIRHESDRKLLLKLLADLRSKLGF